MKCVYVILAFVLTVEAGRDELQKAPDNTITVKQASVAFSYRGDTVDEAIYANPQTYVVTYDVKSASGDFTVVDDYTRYMRVVRLYVEDLCVVASIQSSRTFKSGDEFAEWKTNTNRSMIREEMHIAIPEEGPYVTDMSTLSTEAVEVCERTPIYYGQIEVVDIGQGQKLRPKRGSWWKKAVKIVKAIL